MSATRFPRKLHASRASSKARQEYRGLAVAMEILFAATAVSCGVIFLGLLVSVLPQGDDLCRHITWPLQAGAGLQAYVKFIYIYWSGRWAAMATEVLLLSSLPLPSAYPFLIFSVVAIQLAVVGIAAWALVRKTKLAIGIAIFIGCYYFATMPNTLEGIFWFTGAWENQLPLALGLLVFVLFFALPKGGSPRPTRYRVAACCVLGVVIPALHELFGAILLVATSVTAVYMVRNRISMAKSWLAVTAAVWLGFLVVFLAPGNAARMMTYPGHRNLALTLHLLATFAQGPLAHWLLDIKHWILVLLIWIDPDISAFRRRYAPAGLAVTLLLTACWLVLLAACAAAVAWNTGEAISGRTEDMAYGVFLGGLLLVAFLQAGRLDRLAIMERRRQVFRSLLVVAACLLILASRNVRFGAADLVEGRPTAWNAQWKTRFASLRKAPPQSGVRVDPLAVLPRSYPGWDIRPDPQFWINQCVAQSFGGPSARISLK